MIHVFSGTIVKVVFLLAIITATHGFHATVGRECADSNRRSTARGASSLSKVSVRELPLPPGRCTRRFPLNIFSDDTVRLLNPKSMASYQLTRQKQYGDVFKTNIFFAPTVVATSDAALQDLAGREASARMKAFFPPHHQKLFGPSSVLVTSGTKHGRIRRLIAGSLTPTVVASSYRPVVESSVDQLFNDLQNDASAVDTYQPMVPRLRLFFIQLMLQIVLGADESNLGEVEKLSADIEIWSRGLLAPPLTFLPWSTAGRALRARKRIADTLRGWMDESTASTNVVREGGVLSKLMSARDENGEKLSDDEIIDNVLTLLFAGSDTTASAAISVWKVLSEDASVRRELLDATDDQLGRFVLNVLAKYPPAPFGMRRNGDTDTEIGGYRVPAGWLVVYGFAGALLSRPDSVINSDWRLSGRSVTSIVDAVWVRAKAVPRTFLGQHGADSFRPKACLPSVDARKRSESRAALHSRFVPQGWFSRQIWLVSADSPWSF